MLALLVLLSGCAKQWDVDGDLINVQNNTMANSTLALNDGKFSVGSLDVSSNLKGNNIFLSFKNNSSNTVLIHWNESFMIDSDNTTHKVFFTESERFINTDRKKLSINPAPTLVPSQMTLSGVLCSADNFMHFPATYRPGYSSCYGGNKCYTTPGHYQPEAYVYKGIILRNTESPIEQDIKANLNKIFKISLAIEQENIKSEVMMSFLVKNIVEK